MAVDPLGLVPQGVADTGAAVVFGRSPEVANATNMLYKEAEQQKKKNEEQQKVKNKALNLPDAIGWYPYQNQINEGYNAFVESVTMKKAQGIDIDRDPDTLMTMQKILATVGATNTKKKEIDDLLKYTRDNQDKIENADELYAYINNVMTGQVPLKDLISTPAPTPVLKPEKEEPLNFYKTLSTAFGDPQNYAYPVTIEEGTETEATVKANTEKIDAQAEFFVETPEGIEWTKQFYGGDKSKAKGAAKTWIENQVKESYKLSQDEPKGSGANIADEEIYDRNEKIYYLQNGLRFTDPQDKEKARQILGAIIGAKTTNGSIVKDAEFVAGKGGKGDILLLKAKRKVGDVMMDDDVEIDLTDPASYGELNQLMNSNTFGNIKIPNEVLQKWNAENPSTFNTPLASGGKVDEKEKQIDLLTQGLQAKKDDARNQLVGKTYNGKKIKAITEVKRFWESGKYGDIKVIFEDEEEIVIPNKDNKKVREFVTEALGTTQIEGSNNTTNKPSLEIEF